MQVCAISDLHGRLPQLPDCDAVVIAGDVCPDHERRGYYDHDLMRESQTDWLMNDFAEWEQTWPASVVHCGATWGNHDWVTAFPANCRMTAHVDELVLFDDKKVWFTPWVSPCGAWNYQMCREQRAKRFADIPYKVDLLVMHGPAYDCGDLTYSNDSVGCREMRAVIQQKQPRFVVFGHIHEGQRYGREFRLGGSKCFNVAMWGAKWEPLVIEL
jgi:Icc-related predicted phosphoesterase